jgi:hypothetical protein
MEKNFHPEAKAPCNNLYHAENKCLILFLRTFGRGRPPTGYGGLLAVGSKSDGRDQRLISPEPVFYHNGWI